MMHLVYLCVCPHDNFKTIADICFLIGNYIVWRKIWSSSHAKVIGQSHFSERSRGRRLPVRGYG